MSKTLKKSRVWMYVQQVDHLVKDLDCEPADLFNCLDSLLRVMQEKNNLKDWAYVLHDKDKSEKDDQELVAPHIHVVLYFKNNLASAEKVAGYFKGRPSDAQPWHGTNAKNNAFSYLVHQTDQARKEGKYPYDPEIVVASFDYEAHIKYIKDHVVRDDEEIETFMHQYMVGTISKSDLVDRLGPVVMARPMVKSQLKNLEEGMRLVDHKVWLERMREENRKIVAFFIYGEGGLGKTRLAKHRAAEYVNSLPSDEIPEFAQGVFVSNNARDMFEGYTNQRAVILDDLRPFAFNIQWFLNMFDPYHYDKSAESRYHNKSLAVERFYITTSMDPIKFFRSIKGSTNENLHQLVRRFVVIEVTPTGWVERIPVIRPTMEEQIEEKEFEPIIYKCGRRGPPLEFDDDQKKEDATDYFKELIGDGVK